MACKKPEYTYKVNGWVLGGSPIWKCAVLLGGREYVVVEERGKQEAKEKACEETCSRLVATNRGA